MCHCCDCITLSPKTFHAHMISTLRTKLLKFSNIKKIFEKSENFLMYLKKMLYYQDIFIYTSDPVWGLPSWPNSLRHCHWLFHTTAWVGILVGVCEKVASDLGWGGCFLWVVQFSPSFTIGYSLISQNITEKMTKIEIPNIQQRSWIG